VPVENLIDVGDKGFSGIIAFAASVAIVCMDETVVWARERVTLTIA